MIKGLRSKKSSIRPGLFQSLAILEMVVSHKEKSTLHHIREARMHTAYATLHQDIRKTSVVLFLNELLYKILQEENGNRDLFSFIISQLLWFDQADRPVPLFQFFLPLS